MSSLDEQSAPDRRRVRPYAMTGGRTRPTHQDLEIETLVATTSTGELTPKLTVEQGAIAALCHEIYRRGLRPPPSSPGRHPRPGRGHGR